MLQAETYGQFETAWCPGCGNHDILASLKKALAQKNILPHELLMVSGIGQAAKAPHYINSNVFNGLHGRALPVATGAKLANPDLTVLVESGDGCLYGEGGNHLMATIRRNIDITILAHNNGIYGLTKGQASPTTHPEVRTHGQPFGILSEPFNPLVAAIALGAGFVARGFSADPGLPALICKAIEHPGIALLDILTPCVSYNKFNTFSWYKKRMKSLPEGYDPSDRTAAMAFAESWDNGIYSGVLYLREKMIPMEKRYAMLKNGPLGRQPVSLRELEEIQRQYL